MATTRKPPIGKPGPAPTGPASDEDFTYDSPAGQITVPSLARIKAGVIRKARHLDAAGQMFAVIEAVADADTLAQVDDLDAADFNDFMTEWTQHSGVSLGE